MPNNELKYTGRAQTMSTNTARASELVSMAADDMELVNSGGQKIPLSDVKRIREIAAEFFRECADRGTMPNVRGLAARLGCTRQALYYQAKQHPDSDFARWLEDFSDACGEVMMAAAVEGVISPVPAIFTAKARYQWRDTITIETPSRDPLGPQIDPDALAEQLAEKYAELPE